MSSRGKFWLLILVSVFWMTGCADPSRVIDSPKNYPIEDPTEDPVRDPNENLPPPPLFGGLDSGASLSHSDQFSSYQFLHPISQIPSFGRVYRSVGLAVWRFRPTF